MAHTKSKSRYAIDKSRSAIHAPRKKKLSFTKRDGTVVTFKAKSKRAPAKTRAQLEQRLTKLPSPKMRANARALWKQAHTK